MQELIEEFPLAPRATSESENDDSAPALDIAATFEHHHPRSRLVVGPDAHRRLPELLHELSTKRVFVVCGQTVAQGPQFALLQESIGHAIVDVFDQVRPQGGRALLQSAADRLRDSGADAVISLGGGAAIDSAKYVILLHSAEHPLDDYAVPKNQGATARPGRVLNATSHRHIAIPTTAGSSSEVMPWAGVRDEERGEKVLFRDPLLVPDVALLDPHFVAPTGPSLTATSGSTAVARAIETLYSRDRQPIADAYAHQALQLLSGNLRRAVDEPDDLDARQATQVGAMLSGIAADNALVSLVHAVGHAVGGRYGLQHGIAHSILLPRSAALLLPSAAAALPRAADALGVQQSATTSTALISGIVAGLQDLFDSMPLPRRLRDVGVAEGDLEDITEHALREPMMSFGPRPITRDEVRQLLQECW